MSKREELQHLFPKEGLYLKRQKTEQVSSCLWLIILVFRRSQGFDSSRNRTD